MGKHKQMKIEDDVRYCDCGTKYLSTQGGCPCCEPPEPDMSGEPCPDCGGNPAECGGPKKELGGRCKYSLDMERDYDEMERQQEEASWFVSKKTGKRTQCFVYSMEMSLREDPMGDCGCGSEIMASQRRKCLEHGCPSCIELVVENPEHRVRLLRG